MIEIIPAIDLIDGKCVRLSQGDYDQCTRYDASPVDMTKRFLDAGMTRIHVVDLDGAKASHPKNLLTLEKIASVNDVKVEWGGGIKTDEALRDTFNAGATYAIIGSIAAKSPHLFTSWLKTYGGDKLVLGADAKDGKIAVSGWLEETTKTISDLVKEFLASGLTQAICTDISKDGMLQGPSYELYTELQSEFPEITFTVSGGISSINDIIKLNDLRLKRVITGKALYENRITLSQISKLLL